MSSGYRRSRGGSSSSAAAASVFGGSVPPDFMGALHPVAENLTPKTIGAANRMVTVRTIAPKTGFIRDMYVAVSVSSGNIDLGIYDTGDTTPTVRTLKAHSGSIACPAAFANAAAVTWDPGAGVVPCTAGQQFEFALAVDNNTASFYQGPATAGVVLPSSHWVVPGGALPKLAGLVAAGSFPLPGTVSEASLLSGNQGSSIFLFVCARVGAT